MIQRPGLALGVLLTFTQGQQAMGAESFEDAILRKIVVAYQISPHHPAGKQFGPKELLGQALFFDPILSGPRRIACSTCHVRKKGAGDDLRFSVGLGAEGTATERLAFKDAFVIPRNALPLFNRGSSEFVSFFWDGRVQLGATGSLETPLGPRLPTGFDTPLAAAAVFPLAEPDEMLGRSRGDGPAGIYHGGLVGTQNEETNNYQQRTLEVFERLVHRLIGVTSDSPIAVQSTYRELFASAFPASPLDAIGISHLGNALAAYIDDAFELQPAPWDLYVAGTDSAMTQDEKRGAILFYGKGRCAVCHSGTQFSDFEFHGLAVPQLGIGKHSRHIDYGRAAATSRGEDRFTFRTPPLRNVVNTGPWGHSGVFDSLESVITHHFNPVPVLYAVQQADPDEGMHAGRLLSSRSRLLAEMPPMSTTDVGLLVKFLGALSSPPVLNDDMAIPGTVPSGATEFLQ